MSRLPRRLWLGSRTSPPLMTRSNLSFGPMAAPAGPFPAAKRANEPAVARNWRRVLDIDFAPSTSAVFDRAPWGCARQLQTTAMAGGQRDHLGYVRLIPESRQAGEISVCPLCAKSGRERLQQSSALFDDLVGASE